MIETVVESIRVSLVSQHRVVILKEVEGDRHLMIWIGSFEADAIAMALQGVDAARPLPYDLMKAMVVDLGGRVDRILVTDLAQDIFYARIVVEREGRTYEIDSRPSDAIALAVRARVPIYADDSVLERAGVLLDEEGIAERPAEGQSRVNEEELERMSAFRDFIESLDLDDFDKRSKS